MSTDKDYSSHRLSCSLANTTEWGYNPPFQILGNEIYSDCISEI